MAFNMCEVGRLLEAWNLPIKMFQPAIDVWIATRYRNTDGWGLLVSNHADIAFEMLDVYDVKPSVVNYGSFDPFGDRRS